MTAPARTPRSAERYLPLAYFIAALLLVVALVPSTLRPPPDQATQSAELSPDAPPDDNAQSIVSSLTRAQSGTVGAGEGTGTGAGTELVPAVVGKAPARACPGGVGDPPRQVESVYAAPCMGPFTGDNGGSTYAGVTQNEIRIAQIMCTNVVASEDGPIVDTETDGNAKDRTLRAYQRYFNRNYQLYGRRIQLISLNPKNGDVCNQRSVTNKVVQAAEEYGAFAVIADIAGAYDEAIRRKMLVAANWTAGTPDFYTRNYPYAFSPTLDADRMIDANTEFACKQVRNRNADYTDDPNIQGKPRKLGLVLWTGAGGGATEAMWQNKFREACGGRYDSVVTMDTFNEADAAQVSTVMTKFQAEGITTVLLFVDYVFGGQIANAATAQKYFPEWVVCGCFVWDTNIAMHYFVSSAQWRHAFGITAREVPRNNEETDWYRAYRSVEPSGEPDSTIGFVTFPALMQLANGIQMAGPNLTPQTFMEGLLKIPPRTPDPYWSIGGGYSRSDLTYPDWVGYLWWSSTDLAPDDDTGPGAYKHVWEGRKFPIGQQPTDPIPFFQDGVTTAYGT